jgi:antitoxin (DNA-binding transcriptional repressor) of toxin-antitoxin stability system
VSVVKIHDLKNQVEALVTRVQAGETILIEKDGETVARLAPVTGSPTRTARGKIDVTALEEFTRAQTLQHESTSTFIRRMRDEDRY